LGVFSVWLRFSRELSSDMPNAMRRLVAEANLSYSDSVC